MEEFFCTNESATEALGERVALALCASGPRGHATLVTLTGDLGAGKTTFVKGFARALGVSGTIQSPTFVIAKFYAVSHEPFTRLMHVDAYRLESREELKPLGWERVMQDESVVVVMEWPEKVAPIGVTPDLTIELFVDGDGRRVIMRAPHGQHTHVLS